MVAVLHSKLNITSQVKSSMAQDEAYKAQIERLKRRVAELEQQAHTDELTSIMNRRGLMQMLTAFTQEVDFQLKNPDRRQFLIIKSLSILFVDVDDFKKINDQYGHGIGDKVLCEIAASIRGSLRGIDVVGRYGGEEIVVGLIGADLDRAAKIAEDLRRKIEALRFDGEADGLGVTASFGVASMAAGLSLEELLGRADAALSSAKANGKNRVELHG
jgi:diguanylate cyclase (GGDEF)-like protein